MPIFTAIDQYGVDRSRPDLELLKRLQVDQETKNHVENALQLIALLQGDVDTIFQCAQDNVEAIVASLYYNIEDIDSIQKYARDITKDRTNQVSIYYYFLVGDEQNALFKCSSMDWWLLVHMTDILEAHNMLSAPVEFLDEHHQDCSVKAINYFASYYGSSLFHRYHFYKEGIYYLAQCESLGKECIVHVRALYNTKKEILNG